MARRGSGLAARFKAAVDDQDAQKTEAQKQAEAQAAEGREQREELLRDLKELGGDLPIDRVRANGEGVTFFLGDQQLRFLREGDDQVRVDYSSRADGDEQILFRQAELGHRWVWSRKRRKKETRLPLFDQALELLLVHGLGLPDPAAAASVASSTDDPPNTEERKRTL